ncbi:hypothetical protein CRG98_050342 [Punica granatum]|uniref:Uncharacterized protein n=1 Tax=Punica granatum TaxID=22663 RepID=A0A2I0GEC4_PUNGR|nr:hypothetical protein CRG98_050342 [Punica granatum]
MKPEDKFISGEDDSSAASEGGSTVELVSAVMISGTRISLYCNELDLRHLKAGPDRFKMSKSRHDVLGNAGISKYY